jgi:diguanylate cyclase (GGDEF)-like protein
VIAVVAVVALQFVHQYLTIKHRLVSDLGDSARHSALTLSHNAAGFIAAYSPNEYDLLLQHEMDRQDYLAVVVEDRLMGEVLGEPAYVTGKVRDADWHVTDYQVGDPAQEERLRRHFSLVEHEIRDDADRLLGRLRLYLSDRFIQQELDELFTNHLTNALLMTLVLLIAIYLSIYHHALRPLSDIVRKMRHTDGEGVPLETFTPSGAEEIHTLTSAMNRMIASIRESKDALREKQQYLQSIMDSIDDPIMVINLDRSIGMMNAAARADIEKLGSSDALQTRCFEVLQCDAQNRTSSPGHSCPLTVELSPKDHQVFVHRRVLDGRIQHLEVSVAPLFNSKNELTGLIEVGRDVTQHLEMQEQLREQQLKVQHQATHDALTGLANRYLFNDRLEQALKKARRNATKVAVLFIDLDHFKQVNDSFGHAMGDLLLEQATDRLRRAMREEDSLARLGGDEFVVMIEEVKQDYDASTLAGKLMASLSEPFRIDGYQLFVSGSIGISMFPQNGTTAGDLLKQADAAMYQAKDEGRNNYRYFTQEMTDKAMERLTLESQLRVAINDQEFTPYYQPQVNSRTGDLVGMEALVRWHSPLAGPVTPDRFIPVAESMGQMYRIDRIVMRKAVQQVMAWRRQGLDPGVLALNLTQQHLHMDDFISGLKTLLEETGCEPGWLELEITEGQIMAKPEETVTVLNQVSDLGIRLALDDFGTGYSSLSHLKKLPIHKLKIDRSFVQDLPDDVDDVVITNSIIALASNMGIEVLAEGVETADQKDFLLQQGCEVVQGYYYDKPLNASTMEERLRSTDDTGSAALRSGAE